MQVVMPNLSIKIAFPYTGCDFFVVHLWRTYSESVFVSFMEMWKFSESRDYGIRLARIDYAVRLRLYVGGYSISIRVWSISSLSRKVLPQPP